MKKIICFTLVCLFLFSCTQNSKTSNTFNQETIKTYKVIELVDTLVSVYPNLYVNDVHKERLLKFLHMELDKKLTDDNSFLSEIPMQFSQMLKKGNNKYILKFECGKYTTDDKQLVSENSKTDINFAIFSEVDADFASTLENKAIYTIAGTYKGYVDGKLALPSGIFFDYPSNCYKTSFEENGTICLGGFLFENIVVLKK